MSDSDQQITHEPGDVSDQPSHEGSITVSNADLSQQTARSLDLKDIRTVGIGAIALIALAMALPWIVVSAPLIGSISLSGYKSGGDG